jgi:predicted house-cleaning noncanonical NTP pyrophosphatase (MazG superfamily)
LKAFIDAEETADCEEYIDTLITASNYSEEDLFEKV